MSAFCKVWVGNYSEYPVGDEWDDVVIRKDSRPDRRYNRGKEMEAHFEALDEHEAES